jgi:hypothetical protein
MIRCHRRHLEARCRERGYTFDEVRACIVSEDGGRLVVDETHTAYPRARQGLGDMVKSALSAVGITEERVTKAIGKPCGCGQRAAKLNELGHKYLGLPPGRAG